MMFERVLIANRGEIACRIIRTCRRLGIRTIAVFSEADAGAQHVRQADAAWPIGGPRPQDSYLRGDAIINAARKTGKGTRRACRASERNNSSSRLAVAGEGCSMGSRSRTRKFKSSLRYLVIQPSELIAHWHIR